MSDFRNGYSMPATADMSVDAGLRNLRRAATQPNDFQLEARLILALLEETYYKKPAAALSLMETLRRQQPDNLLVSYLLGSVMGGLVVGRLRGGVDMLHAILDF